jgi:2'-5' RNA ligase
VRLFLAIKPDRSAEAQLGHLLLELQQRLGEIADALRWTPANNVHATLHFLGEVDTSRHAMLREALGTTVAETGFAVSLGNVGIFPAAGPPRVVWLAVGEGAERLTRIHQELGERLTRAGFSIEARPFSPHVTVARVRDRDRRRVKHLRERLAQVEAAPISWMADRVTLFRSDLSGSTPRYDAVHEIRFAS